MNNTPISPLVLSTMDKFSRQEAPPSDALAENKALLDAACYVGKGALPWPRINVKADYCAAAAESTIKQQQRAADCQNGLPVEIEVKGRKVMDLTAEQLRNFTEAQRPPGAPVPRASPADDYMALAAAHSVNQPARFYGSEFPPITIALRLDTRHNAVLEGLADEQGMTKEQVMRQALRIYQMIHTRAKEGKALAFTKDGVVMPEVVGLPWL